MLEINNIKLLAELIKKERKKQGISQEALAGLANTGTRFIVDLEQAKPSCQIEKVFNVIKALGIKLGINDAE